jgi:hypothetical protein
MGVVDFSRYVPFEAADDFGFGEPVAVRRWTLLRWQGGCSS